MALISLLSRLVAGVERQVDLSTNTLVLGAMQLKGATSGTFTQNVPATVTTYSVVWPSAQAASSGYVLSNDGAGNLSWVSATASDVLDGTFRIDNTSDPTKKIAFDASGIATATTRTITMPDSNVNLGLIATAIQRNGSVAFTANQPMGSNKLTGLSAGTTAGDSVRYEQAILISGVNAFAADQSHGGFKITNLANPTSAQDGATKFYVDNLAQGLSWKHVVRIASTINLNLASMPATIQGVTLVSGDRFLAKDQSTASQNGIYIFNGAASAATRALDADTALELQWATLEVGADDPTQAGYIYRESLDIVTLGSDTVTFVILSHGLDWTFTNGLSVSGNVVNVAPGDSSLTATPGSLVVALNAASGLVTSSGLKINLETSNPGLQISSNKLDVKYNPAGAIVANAAGITWNPDGSSLEISANAARIKTTAYDQATITGGGGSAAAVAYAPALKESLVAGETFAATTLFAVRFAKAADSGFVAGRVYKADNDATTVDNFWAIGLVYNAGSTSAGSSMLVTKNGLINVPTHGFTVGQPLWLGASGAITATAPSASNICAIKVGMVRDANNIEVQIGYPHVA